MKQNNQTTTRPIAPFVLSIDSFSQFELPTLDLINFVLDFSNIPNNTNLQFSSNITKLKMTNISIKAGTVLDNVTIDIQNMSLVIFDEFYAESITIKNGPLISITNISDII